MEPIDHMFTFLPSWVQIVTFILLVCFGFGGFSKILTLFLTRKKTESEANLIEANATAKNAVTKKIDEDSLKSVIAEYKIMLEEKKKDKEDLQLEINGVRKSLQEVQVDHQNQINGLNSKIEKYKATIDSLKAYIKTIEIQWLQITEKPFPKWKFEEDEK